MSAAPDIGCPHEEMAVAWALHALEPAEEMQIAAHLPDCEPCTRAVAEAEEVGAVLGLAVPLSEPSADLRDRVLAIPDLAADLAADLGDPDADDDRLAGPSDGPVLSGDPVSSGDPAVSNEPVASEGVGPEELPAPRSEPSEPAGEPPRRAGTWPSPTAGSSARRASTWGSGPPPRRYARWDPACVPESVVMLLVILVACAVSAAIVYYLV